VTLVTDPIRTIAEAVAEAGGRALVVGGWVRDRLLGRQSKDVDVEVYGLDAEALKGVLRRLGRVNTVGESFTVYKVTIRGAAEVDVSIPRRESKTGRGHRGFAVAGDPAMTVEEAARRRDFTINAILYDPLRDEVIDPYGGARDLAARRLRVVDPETFVDDSLRVLRAAQFAARFELEVDPATAELCRRVDLSDLPPERVWGEVEKLLLRAERPSVGLEALRELAVLPKLFPELAALGGREWEATKRAADEARRLVGGDDLPLGERTAVMLAALFGGLDAGAAERMLDRLNVHTVGGYHVRRQTLALVAARAEPARLLREGATDGDLRRLALRVDCRLLTLVVRAGGDAAAAEWFLERARGLGVERCGPDPILLGRHVLELGVEPGPEVGRVTRAVYELQLDGDVRDLDGAIEAARRLVGGE
jgi:tRNA nucleotidyltransferase (CCA-adding enzyme)